MNQLKNTSNFPSKITLDGKVAEDPQSICNLFADYFSTVFKQPSTDPPDYSYKSTMTCTNWRTTAVNVERKLDNLDPKKGAGPDDIPPSTLKFCSSVLAPHLTIFWNCFFSSGIFPSCLKPGYVVPIFKSGDRTLASNYRPVVILSALSKVFESLLLDGLDFELKQTIIPQQHGFRSGRSATTNLTLFHNYITPAFTEGAQVDCVLLDFAKAFDRVSHLHFVAKLEAMGLSGSLLMFLISYLRKRTLRVRCGFFFSYPLHALSGVPQGSRLGPHLCNLFINDICLALAVMLLLFADDVKLFLKILSVQDHQILQAALSRIEDWCIKNDMELNISKCVVITFTRSSNPLIFDYTLFNTSLRRVLKVKDLGVITTSTLHPGEHIQHICNKANSTLGFILRLTRDNFSVDALLVLYKALVRPLLEYNSPVWSPYQQGLKLQLEKIQNRLLRVIGVRDGLRYL